MQAKLLTFCLMLGILCAHNAQASSEKSTIKPVEETTNTITSTTTTTQASIAAATATTAEATKDKRQIGDKDTPLYPNHRSDTNVDDPEEPQESIYGPKPTQFLIRPIAQQHQQQHQQHQPQLRNYPATIRPHSSQLLEQSPEIQHFAYLQDISRNQAKAGAQLQGKRPTSQIKKLAARAQPQTQYSNAEEAEQRYAVAIQAAQQPHAYPAPRPYHLPQQLQQQQQQEQQQQQQQQYQVIPEEQFLKLIEDELQARAYHDAQDRQQQQADNAAAGNGATQPDNRAGQGLGNYRHRIAEEPSAPEYVPYVPQQRAGPRYLPHQQHQQQQLAESPPELPPQLAYYQPQLQQQSNGYKALPNHPLAKSSLEKEIEKLLAANKPSAAAVQIVDNYNEPSAVVNHQQQQQQQHLQLPKTRAAQPKQPGFFSNTTPNSLLDANNQPFIPSLFRFSNFQPPTPVYPTQLPQHVIDAKKLGPVVYPTQAPLPAAQPSQYVYQEAASPTPSAKPKAYRAKQYGSKIPAANKQLRERDNQYPAASVKYAQPLYYDFDPQAQAQAQQQSGPVQFFPSPPDPITTKGAPLPPQQPTHATHSQPPANDFRQFAPSQSSIYVSQGTGISPPSRPTGAKPKTAADVKQLNLPQPGDKPLTQAEFQALIDAGYPVTAVPVPVPVPYEQYVKSHPEYRNQQSDYAQLARFAQHQQQQNQQQQYVPSHLRQRALAQPSEPSLKILSSPTPTQSASALGGGSVTYLRAIGAEQKRRPRDEKDTEVLGKTEN